MRKPLSLGLALAFCASALHAHEFWVAPLTYQVQLGDEISLDLRVGQMFEGRSYPYLTHKFARYQITDNSGVHNLLGNEGDFPSVVYDATVPGLHVIAYHALPEQLTYDEFQNFIEYVQEEGLSSIVARHRERDLPETGFTEAYVRNAKALVQVGPVAEGDADSETGMAFEFVALKNPYSGGEILPVKLLWQGSNVPNAQVAVFHQVGMDEVVRTTYQTDNEGVAHIPLIGGGTFLLSSVHLEEITPDSGAVWQSTWASMTFGLPEVGQQ